jgi:cysteine desulfurase/selenocysteine lyase
LASVCREAKHDIFSRTVRADFPVLSREVNGQPLAYLDSAASAQKPEAVIAPKRNFIATAMRRCIAASIPSARKPRRMEQVRQQAATFLNARSAEELVFVRGTTEGINLVANSWGNANVGAGDNIIISAMEHHANIVPWQMLCASVGAQLRVIPLNPDGTLQLDAIPACLTSAPACWRSPRSPTCWGPKTRWRR